MIVLSGENMKFSYVMLPDYPLEESLRAIKLADELGFYGCYAADETVSSPKSATIRRWPPRAAT